MNITILSLDQFRRPERNVRHHPQKQIEEMKRSLAMFGQTRPLVVDGNYTVLVGNGMLTAMEQLGWTEAECYVYDSLTPTQAKKLMLADNRVYDLGLTDLDAFDAILQELSGDIDIPGWDEDLLKTLTASTAEVDAMIGSYGTYSPQAVENIKRREGSDWASFADDARSGPPAGYAAPPHANIGQDSAEHERPVATAQNGTDDGPCIICPHCGARIPIGGDG